MRDAILSLITSGGCATSLQDAVEPVADAVELLVGLEVDVGHAGADRVEQDLLDVPDDRRVLDFRALLVGCCVAFGSRSTSRSPSPTRSFSVVPSVSTTFSIASPSLSSSTTTGSMTRLVLKRTSSSACRLAGSDTATNRRLPRLCSGSTRRVAAILGSTNSLLIWSRSKPVRSSSGAPKARDANTATCDAVIRLLTRICSTKPMLAACAWSAASRRRIRTAGRAAPSLARGR